MWQFMSIFLLAITIFNSSVTAVIVQNPANGHWYELVQEAVLHDEARVAAAASTFNGQTGYLVTITSQQENDFIVNQFNDDIDAFVWFGATDRVVDGATEGNWRWVAGPEAGTQFWTGGVGGSVTAPFNYANWGPAEPNNFGNGENVAGINLGPLSAGNTDTGQWGDTNDGVRLGYIIEYIPEPASACLLILGMAVASIRTRV